MAFGTAIPKVFPVTPDWSNGVGESLSWATEQLRSSATAATHTRSYRLGPRRAFSFEVLAGGAEHRALEMLLAGWRGAWLLPVWHDVQWLAGPVPAGSETIACRTAGFDFVAGGHAVLYAGLNTWEVVAIAAVEGDHIALEAPSQASFSAGARLYPLRRARIQDGAESAVFSDDIGINAPVSRRTLEAEIIETCDWPALEFAAEYLGHPVLDVRPDRTENPLSSFAGFRVPVDFGAAVPAVGDLPGITLRAQRDSWELRGRAEHTWFRSLLYALHGRVRPLWVPSWSADLQPASAIAGGSTSLVINWAGYALFGLGRPNRRDLVIHLRDGRVLYRRVVDAFEAGGVESLTLDAPLDVASIAPGAIAQVSIMALATLASDSVEIQHLTDAAGVANATTGWQAVVPDV